MITDNEIPKHRKNPAKRDFAVWFRSNKKWVERCSYSYKHWQVWKRYKNQKDAEAAFKALSIFQKDYWEFALGDKPSDD